MAVGKSIKPNPRGEKGEQYAADVLTGQGYRVIARNFSSRLGEIDIIAVKYGVIAFVEVKTRRENSVVSCAEAVTKTKQRKIIATALLYLQGHPCDLQPRFDVFCVVTDSAQNVISHEHLAGAFEGGDY